MLHNGIFIQGVLVFLTRSVEKNESEQNSTLCGRFCSWIGVEGITNEQNCDRRKFWSVGPGHSSDYLRPPRSRLVAGSQLKNKSAQAIQEDVQDQA